MSPSLLATRTLSSPIVHRLAPWIVVLVVGGLLIGVLPSAEAQTGATASGCHTHHRPTASSRAPRRQAPSSGTSSTTSATTRPATITVTFQPTDSNRLDVFLFTGDPANPTQSSASATLTDNVRTIQFTDPGSARVVFVRVDNDHTDRSVSFVGDGHADGNASPRRPRHRPTNPARHSRRRRPARSRETPQRHHPGHQRPVHGHARLPPGGLVPLLLRQPGRRCRGQVSLAPNANRRRPQRLHRHRSNQPRADQQGGNRRWSTATRSRGASHLPNAQFVFFSLANNNDDADPGLRGNVTPFITPPATVTPTTPTAAVTSTADRRADRDARRPRRR